MNNEAFRKNLDDAETKFIKIANHKEESDDES